MLRSILQDFGIYMYVILIIHSQKPSWLKGIPKSGILYSHKCKPQIRKVWRNLIFFIATNRLGCKVCRNPIFVVATNRRGYNEYLKSCSRLISMLRSILQDFGTYMGVLSSKLKSGMLMSTLIHSQKSHSLLISLLMSTLQDFGIYIYGRAS
jgi:hypothetical protein